jgi:hypothetical protein
VIISNCVINLATDKPAPSEKWPRTVSIIHRTPRGVYMLTVSHVVSRRLCHSRATSTRKWVQTPWSERFDRIFRNEGVTGSNPVSSTDFPLY